MNSLLNARKKRRIIILATTIYMSSFCGLSYANDSIDSSTAVNVGVVGKNNITKNEKQKKKIENKIFKSTVNANQVTRQQIEQRVIPGGNVLTAANSVPGVNIRTNGVGGGADREQLRINGVRAGFNGVSNPLSQGITFLFDGIPLNNPFGHLTDNVFPISTMIDHIIVVQGPGEASNHYPNSFGGSINLIPRKPTGKFGGQVSIGGGSFDSYSSSTVLNLGSLDGWKTLFSAGYTQSGLGRSGDLSGDVNKAQAYYLATSKRINRNVKTSFGIYYAMIQDHRPNYIPVYPVNGVNVNGFNSDSAPYSETTSGFHSAPDDAQYKIETYKDILAYNKTRINLTKNSFLNSEFWYRGLSVYKIGGDPSNVPYYPNLDQDGTGNETRGTNSFGYRLTAHIMSKNNHVEFGGYYWHIDEREQNGSFNYGDPISEPYHYQSYSYPYSNEMLFAQDTFIPVKWFRLNAGLAFQNYSVSVANESQSYIDENFDNPSQIAYPKGPSISKQYTALSPNVGLNIIPYRGVNMFFDWSVNHKTGNNGETGGGTNDVSFNAPTKLGSFESFVGGIRYHHKDFKAELSAFHQLVKNVFVSYSYVIYSPSGNTEVIVYNPADSTYNGVNFFAGYEPTSGFYGYINGTMQHAFYNSYLDTQTLTTYHGLPVSTNPSFQVSSLIGYRLYNDNSLYNFQLMDNYTSSIYLGGSQIPSTTLLPYGAANILNLRLTDTTSLLSSVLPFVKGVKLGLYVDNILNRKYNEIGRFGGSLASAENNKVIGAVPGAGRSVYGSLTAYF